MGSTTTAWIDGPEVQVRVTFSPGVAPVWEILNSAVPQDLNAGTPYASTGPKVFPNLGFGQIDGGQFVQPGGSGGLPDWSSAASFATGWHAARRGINALYGAPAVGPNTEYFGGPGGSLTGPSGFLDWFNGMVEQHPVSGPVDIGLALGYTTDLTLGWAYNVSDYGNNSILNNCHLTWVTRQLYLVFGAPSTRNYFLPAGLTLASNQTVQFEEHQPIFTAGHADGYTLGTASGSSTHGSVTRYMRSFVPDTPSSATAFWPQDRLNTDPTLVTGDSNLVTGATMDIPLAWLNEPIAVGQTKVSSLWLSDSVLDDTPPWGSVGSSEQEFAQLTSDVYSFTFIAPRYQITTVTVDVVVLTPEFTWVVGPSGRLVNFNASSSTGTNAIVSYTWDFADVAALTVVQPLTGVTVDHLYYSAGPFLVTLTVVDSVGTTASVSHLVELPPSSITGAYVEDRNAFTDN